MSRSNLKREKKMSFFGDINSPLGIITFMCALVLIFLNGFTDAPNAIATTVATDALSMNKACVLCALCNLIGLGIMSLLNLRVAEAIYSLASLGDRAQGALFASLLAVIIFTIFAWLISMPSSESHALMSALVGASLALGTSVSLTPLFKIVIYMLLSCIGSALGSLLTAKLLKNTLLPYRRLQILSCAVMSLSHGAQDGQKLLGVLLLLAPSAKSRPLAPTVLVCMVLFLGTLLGGGKITKMLGRGISTLNEKSAFIADLGAGVCLLVCSLLGVPVSTSNVKACAIATSAYCDGRGVNIRALVKIAYVALATIPACAVLSYLITKLIF